MIGLGRAFGLLCRHGTNWRAIERCIATLALAVATMVANFPTWAQERVYIEGKRKEDIEKVKSQSELALLALSLYSLAPDVRANIAEWMPDVDFGEVLARPRAQADTGAPSCKNNELGTKKPVKIATGEKFLFQSDFQSAGISGMHFSRTYRSQFSSGSWFGPNWHAGLEPLRLKAKSPAPCTMSSCPDGILLVESDAQEILFKLDGDKLTASGNLSAGELVVGEYGGNSWTLKRRGERFYFDGTNHLASYQELRTGKTLTYTYSNGEFPASPIKPASQSL